MNNYNVNINLVVLYNSPFCSVDRCWLWAALIEFMKLDASSEMKELI